MKVQPIRFICTGCDKEVSTLSNNYGPYRRNQFCSECRRLQNLARMAGTNVRVVRATYIKQKGICALCDMPIQLKRWRAVLDHDHFTGRFRGILCCACNMTLHSRCQTKAWFEKAMKYLEL